MCLPDSCCTDTHHIIIYGTCDMPRSVCANAHQPASQRLRSHTAAASAPFLSQPPSTTPWFGHSTVRHTSTSTISHLGKMTGPQQARDTHAASLGSSHLCAPVTPPAQATKSHLLVSPSPPPLLTPASAHARVLTLPHSPRLNSNHTPLSLVTRSTSSSSSGSSGSPSGNGPDQASPNQDMEGVPNEDIPPLIISPVPCRVVVIGWMGSKRRYLRK